ncbi:MAG TPA: 50S ribosomal protein L23 [Candidatus Sumerlaeota bacterium]|nr:50S ribosomal protein L23 [Candidatus Sumerlaeota bacterium]HMX63031.1 50S ribosomal protein L23 [Candidatus Sumerlaeota bacterium]HNM46846.1 50S ribosomal protein L23 [Candidatus Sumerlaeota bacterium]
MSQKSPYQIIDRPMITEKALAGAEPKREYTFRVARGANKREIKWAIETAYGVKVESVNTVLVKGKIRHARVRGAREGKRADVKKAIVKLAEGQQIATV